MTYNFGRKLKILLFLMFFLVVVLAAACGKTVVRENILSSIESGVGITVSQNKQTQMYEVKAGFIRSQFYSIPTGKVVENDASVFTDISTCRKIASMPIGTITPPERAKVFSILSSCVHEKKTQTSNAANLTPELVSGIRAHTGWQDLFLGMDVSESFAVGKEAVKSDAAVAMYITMAKDKENANAASQAVLKTLTPSNTEDDTKARVELEGYLAKTLKDNQDCGGVTFNHTNKTIEFANCLANIVAPGKTLAYVKYVGGKNLLTLNEKLKAAVQQ